MTILSYVLIATGLLVTIIGSFGIANLPNIYARLQASGAADTSGFVLVLLGFLVYGGFEYSDVFLGLLIIFVFITGPIINHAI
ncbi:MAG: cation:proton antiporter, partial [Candidatus Bipolaricaulota bacterium]